MFSLLIYIYCGVIFVCRYSVLLKLLWGIGWKRISELQDSLIMPLNYLNWIVKYELICTDSFRYSFLFCMPKKKFLLVSHKFPKELLIEVTLGVTFITCQRRFQFSHSFLRSNWAASLQLVSFALNDTYFCRGL